MAALLPAGRMGRIHTSTAGWRKIGLDWMALTPVEADHPAGSNVGMTDRCGPAGAVQTF
jgi:hypothetical protein